jgi:hypothetical protein
VQQKPWEGNAQISNTAWIHSVITTIYKGNSMPVTSLQTVQNNLDDSIIFVNTENSGNNRQVRAGRSRGLGNCWIPWCTKEEDFPPHHIQIVDKNTSVVIAFIWQHGDLVRFSQNGFEDPADPIDGEAAVGGSYDLVLAKDDKGKPTVTAEKA